MVCQQKALSNAESEDATWKLKREAIAALQQVAAACSPHPKALEEAAPLVHPSKHTAILTALS